jgi:hypothetical protein
MKKLIGILILMLIVTMTANAEVPTQKFGNTNTTIEMPKLDFNNLCESKNDALFNEIAMNLRNGGGHSGSTIKKTGFFSSNEGRANLLMLGGLMVGVGTMYSAHNSSATYNPETGEMTSKSNTLTNVGLAVTTGLITWGMVELLKRR